MKHKLFNFAALLAALTLAGCASSPLPPAPSTTAAAAPAAAAVAAPAPASAGSAQALRDARTRDAELAAANAAAAARAMAAATPEPMSVFFGFDEYTLGPDATPVVDRYGKFLSANAAARLRVEGHCDERGGREYNLALGAKRAQAVVTALRLMGAPDAAMEAISYGKERPRAQGSNEAAWAQNRRADLQLR